MFFLLPTITFTGLLIKQLPCIHLHSPSLSIFRYFWVFFITRIPIAHMSYRRFSDQSPPDLRQPQPHHLHTISEYTFFYKKPRVRGSGSAFLRISEFEAQKFFKLIKIPVFSFLEFSFFEPLIFLKYFAINTS